MQITKNKIIYDADDWIGGIDLLRPTLAVDKKVGKGLASAINFDPYRDIGYAQPGFRPTDVTRVAEATAFLKKGCSYNGKVVITSANDLLHELTLSGSSLNDTPHQITHGAHTGVSGEDIVLYNQSGTLKMFYSWNDGTDWNVGTYALDTFASGTFDDDFMSTPVGSGGPINELAAPYLTGGSNKPHPMVIGADDVLYIGDRNFVHAYDGATNTFYAAVLTLPNNFIITCLEKFDVDIAVGGYVNISNTTKYYTRSIVFLWDTLSLDPWKVLDLDDNYISDIFTFQNTLACFTEGRIGRSNLYNGDLRILTNGKFESLVSINGIPIRGGSQVIEDGIIWNTGGKVYSYTKNPYSGKFILNQIISGQGTSSGLCGVFDASFIVYVSSGATTTGGLEVAVSGYSDASVYGKVAVPLFPEFFRGKLESITITFKTAGTSGATLNLNINIDNTTINPFANDITSVTNLKIIKIKTDQLGNPLPAFSKIQPVLIWTDGSGKSFCPVVDSIEFEYSLINI